MTADRTEVLDVAAVAAWLQCSPRTVQRKAQALGGFQFGKGLRFTRTAVEAYLERVTRVQRVTVLPPAAPRQIAAGKRGGEYRPVVSGPVPWRTSVVEAASPAAVRGRSTAKRKRA